MLCKQWAIDAGDVTLCTCQISGKLRQCGCWIGSMS